MECEMGEGEIVDGGRERRLERGVLYSGLVSCLAVRSSFGVEIKREVAVCSVASK